MGCPPVVGSCDPAAHAATSPTSRRKGIAFITWHTRANHLVVAPRSLGVLGLASLPGWMFTRTTMSIQYAYDPTALHTIIVAAVLSCFPQACSFARNVETTGRRNEPKQAVPMGELVGGSRVHAGFRVRASHGRTEERQLHANHRRTPPTAFHPVNRSEPRFGHHGRVPEYGHPRFVWIAALRGGNQRRRGCVRCSLLSGYGGSECCPHGPP